MRSVLTMMVIVASASSSGCGGDDTGPDDVDAATGDAAADGHDTAVEVADTSDLDTSDLDTSIGPCSPTTRPDGVTVVADGRYLRLSGLPTAPELPERLVTVYLPADYDTRADTRYPVLYMHDGQNLFDAAATPFGEWGVDEVLDGLVTAGLVPATIVVGVHNTAERIADYTPTSMESYGGGNAARYADWLVHTLKPIIDGELRTRCEREHTAVAGSSLGGLVSLYLGMRHPDHFGRLGVVSPSLWWDSRKLLDEWEHYEGRLPDRLWVDMGTNEDEADPTTGLGDGIAEVRRAVDRALARGMALGQDVALLEDLGAVHNEGAWRARLPAALGFLLSDDGFATFTPSGESTLVLRHARDALYTALRPRLPIMVEVQAGARPRLGRMTIPPSLAPLSATGPATLDADQVLVAGAIGDTALAATWGDLAAEVVISTYGADLVPVGFDVRRPTSTPADAVVHVVGPAPGLGAGDPGAVPLRRNGDRWQGERPLAKDAAFTYNYTLGSEATWEADTFGAKRAERTHAAPDPAGTTVVTDRVDGWLGLER